MSDDNGKKKKQTWTEEQEKLLASWSERASGYRWLHSRSEKLYRKRNYSFTIPVIILSTLTGTANFAMDSFVPEENKQLAMACVGGVNIFAGILSTLQNFLRYAELMEGHRVSEVSWSKFSREISVELALEPSMRKPAFDFLTVCRAEFDRLIEQSPTLDDAIVAQYTNLFIKKKKTKKNKELKKTNSDESNGSDGSPRNLLNDIIEEEIDHPHVCNGIHKCRIYQRRKEDVVAENVAGAAHKLLEKKFNKRWDLDIVHEKVNNDSGHAVKNTKINYEHKKELEGLKSIGKVKSFKEKINKEEIEDHPAKEINKIIKAISEEQTDHNSETSAKNVTTLDIDGNLSKNNTHKVSFAKPITESLSKPPTEPESFAKPITESFAEPSFDLVQEPESAATGGDESNDIIINKISEIVDAVETNVKETQTDNTDDHMIINMGNDGDVVVDDVVVDNVAVDVEVDDVLVDVVVDVDVEVERGDEEGSDSSREDIFKEEKEIKDFLSKIE